MEDFFSRSEALLGAEAMSRLAETRVILFGVGGVGSWCAEALIRTGLRHLTIVDDDTVQPSNLNRQLPATRDTLGRPKVEALRERLLSINPDAEIIALNERYTSLSTLHTASADRKNSPLSTYDVVVDAIDSVNDKADLLIEATKAGCRVYSSMGAALRFDPTHVRVSSFDRVSGDGLARALRQRFKRLGQYPVHSIRCVWSDEPPREVQRDNVQGTKANSQPPIANSQTKGSLMPVTATFGCTLASLLIRDLQ